LPNDESTVDSAIAAGDAGAAADARAVNGDEFGKMMLEHKSEFLVPPEGGDFRLKTPAKRGVGDVGKQFVY
jgi:hypothetical protein